MQQLSAARGESHEALATYERRERETQRGLFQFRHLRLCQSRRRGAGRSSCCFFAADGMASVYPCVHVFANSFSLVSDLLISNDKFGLGAVMFDDG